MFISYPSLSSAKVMTSNQKRQTDSFVYKSDAYPQVLFLGSVARPEHNADLSTGQTREIVLQSAWKREWLTQYAMDNFYLDLNVEMFYPIIMSSTGRNLSVLDVTAEN